MSKKRIDMLQIGTKAPAFEGMDENGNRVKLSDFAGKKLVLYFYPKDSTPGCTSEACDLRDNYQRFLALLRNTSCRSILSVIPTSPFSRPTRPGE